MENYVKQFRKMISDKIRKSGKMDVILEYDLDKCSAMKKTCSLLIETITFMDLYKKINYRKATSTLTEKDLLLIPLLDSVITTKDIHSLILANTNILDSMINASYEFYNATSLEKIAQIKALNSEERLFLLELIPLFQQDLDLYDKKIKIEIFYDYFQKLQTFYINNSLPFMNDSVIDQMVGFIKNLYHYDQENFIQIVLSLSIIDYKYSSYFLQMDEYPDVANGKRKAIYRKNIFEEGKESDILERALLDDYYLFELLEIYLKTRSLHSKKESYEQEYEMIDTKEKQKVKTIEEKIKKYEKFNNGR